MAEAEKHELLIIKRSRGVSHDHHGGAWKIAFADFMTAMMALFLVLWLINATNQKTKASLARYFNPVDLVDMSTMKRGVHDPNAGPETDGASNGAAFPKSAPNAAQKNGSVSGKAIGAAGPRDVTADEAESSRSPEPPPTHTEEALFRDPYAVLAQIAAMGSSGEAASADKSDQSADNDATGTGSDSYTDPFKATMSASGDVASDTAKAINSAAATSAPAPDKATAVSLLTKDNRSDKKVETKLAKGPTAAAGSAKLEKQQPAQLTQDLADTLAKQIAAFIEPAGKNGATPAIEVKATDEGVLISLTDKSNFAMFAIGSAEPQPKTVRVMDKLARILKRLRGNIIIGGFTDGRPYRSAVYDNWRLSTARAQMAYYMLVRGGVDEKRITRIEGYADRRLKVPNKPFADENRRIEIFLQEKTS